ncbi:Wzz/FepE/Etk N-terminal domain-containing protein [Defluviimonas sp. D31]|uniref:GumC family protein n=1 Tax=Defluviimonas sp. D31 TaxID=3083253 RepID=UPI00296F8C6B|nr:Wzz/FepE/Etk N-terminal domain-containing protein [Defluviimonas sp. D31]MDW4549730.1 Wzz/FepE/Etk N-terminal domain-containing protein [Defluviimonas sp. D31]
MIHRGAGDLHFRQVMTLLRRRWVLIAFVMLIGGGLIGGAAFLLPPRYTAKAQLLPEAEVRQGVEFVDEAAVDTLVELLMSPGQLRRLATDLAEIKANSETPLDLPGFADLEDHLMVFKERRSRLISVSFVSTNPDIASTVVNRAVQVYLGGVSDQMQSEQANVLDTVSRRLETARQDLDLVTANLRDYRVAHGVVDPGRADEIDVQIGQMSRQLAIARAELDAREQQLASESQETAESTSRVANADAAGAVVVEGNLRGRSGAQTLPVNRDQLVRERDEAAARLGDIEARLITLQGAAAAAGEQQSRLQELEREAAAAEEAYEGLLRQRAKLIGSGAGQPPARVVSLAATPERPSSPNPLLFLFPALVGSGAIGAMIALLLERNDQRLRSGRDVELMLRVPCIGLVPKRSYMASDDPADILPQDPFEPYVEAVRSISVAARKRGASTEVPRSFLVTSSADGDGATTTAVGFALYTARLNQRVLLMDLNFRRPGVAAALGDPDLGGEATAKGTKSRPPEYAIRRIESLGIDYLPPPMRKVDPLAVLCSDEFPTMLDRLTKTYDCIVIDSAPLAGATETRLLASMIDRVLFVVKWGVTDARTAQAALHSLSASGAGNTPPVSVVIAQVDMRLQVRRRYGETNASDATAALQPV